MSTGRDLSSRARQHHRENFTPAQAAALRDDPRFRDGGFSYTPEPDEDGLVHICKRGISYAVHPDGRIEQQEEKAA